LKDEKIVFLEMQVEMLEKELKKAKKIIKEEK